MKTALVLATAIGLLYLAMLAFYALMQRSLIYYPTTVSTDQARQQAMALGGAPWLGQDGNWLGWTIEVGADADAGSSAATPHRRRALVFHGNAGMALHRDYYARLLAGFSESGPWIIYIHEYPGYGPRGGKPGQASFVASAVHAVDRLLAMDSAPLLIIGESLGSGVAAQLVRQRPEAIATLLLITPFDTMASLARHHMPWLPAALFLRDRYDSLAALKGFQGPLAVVTAGQDEIVPGAFAEPLLRQHTGPVIHEIQSAAGHNTLHFDPERAPWPAVDRFLNVEGD